MIKYSKLKTISTRGYALKKELAKVAICKTTQKKYTVIDLIEIINLLCGSQIHVLSQFDNSIPDRFNNEL